MKQSRNESNAASSIGSRSPQRSNPRREITLTLLVKLVLQCAKTRLKRYLKVLAKELFIIGDEAISKSQRIPSRRLDFLERCPVVSFGTAEVQPHDVEGQAWRYRRGEPRCLRRTHLRRW